MSKQYYLILEDIEEAQTILLENSLFDEELREALKREQGLSNETIDYLLKNGVRMKTGEEIEIAIEKRTALQTKVGGATTWLDEGDILIISDNMEYEII